MYFSQLDAAQLGKCDQVLGRPAPEQRLQRSGQPVPDQADHPDHPATDPVR